MKLNPERTEKKSWTKIDKKGREETWEWEETPELRAYIQAQATNQLHNDIKDNAKRV
tara:strand:+ start:456 stop:626 length:171 start_codon:yes stop_codon:yes gene_type:complete